MFATTGRWLPLFLAMLFLLGCGDDDDGASIVGPGYPSGAGRIYSVRNVTFRSTDGISISALWSSALSTGAAPVVVLLHDLDGEKQAWLTRSTLFAELLERGYAVLAMDLRGYGETALPDGRTVAQLQDLEVSFLDVLAALDWLVEQPGIDATRVAVVGCGTGGNIAYVSKGAFAERIKTAVSLSPGLWERGSLQPVVIGHGLDPFGPASILYVVGEKDVLPLGDAAGTVLSYVDFARALAATTAAPENVYLVPGSSAHGLDLLAHEPDALSAVLEWLERQL